MQLPDRYKERMKRLLGNEYDAYEACLDQSARAGLRVNTGKITVEEFKKITPFKLTPVPWTEKGFYYEMEESPAKHPYYHAGLYYLQEPSAMLPAALLPIQRGDKVLDLCAAPGGKSTELAARLGGEGVLVSNDVSPSRARALTKNLQLSGVPNAVVLCEEPEHMMPVFYEYFYKILVDATCSGEGIFRKENKMIAAWEEHGPAFFAPLQRKILAAAVKMLKPGGMLLYSTCTFSPEENEGSIAAVLEQFPEMSLVQVECPVEFGQGRPEWIGSQIESLRRCIRVWPHKVGGEGHFVALLQKEIKAGQETDIKDKKMEKKHKKGKKGDGRRRKKEEADAIQTAIEFLKTTSLPYEEEQIILSGECCYLVPEGLPDMSSLRVVESGLLLGSVGKGRFEPYQALASRLNVDLYPNHVNLSVDDIRVIKYLKGETIMVEDTSLKGYVLLLVDGYSLGWGKAAGGMIKNKYFGSWRML